MEIQPSDSHTRSVPKFNSHDPVGWFAQGNVQMQRNTIKHLQEGNLARLQQVAIELLELETGRVMGSIPDVNFVEGMEQMPVGELIGDMLSELKPPNSESSNQETLHHAVPSHKGC